MSRKPALLLTIAAACCAQVGLAGARLADPAGPRLTTEFQPRCSWFLRLKEKTYVKKLAALRAHVLELREGLIAHLKETQAHRLEAGHSNPLRGLLCLPASDYLAHALTERGYVVKRWVNRRLPAEAFDADDHVFLRVLLAGHWVIVDPTFTQFFASLPETLQPGNDILVMPEEDFGKFAVELRRVREAASRAGTLIHGPFLRMSEAQLERWPFQLWSVSDFEGFELP